MKYFKITTKVKQGIIPVEGYSVMFLSDLKNIKSINLI